MADPEHALHEMAEAAIPHYHARLQAIFREALNRKQALAQAPASSAPAPPLRPVHGPAGSTENAPRRSGRLP